MLNEKQIAFFEALKQIKDINVMIFSSYLHPKSKLVSTLLKKEYEKLQTKLTTNEDIESFMRIQNEIIEQVIYEIMVLVDGYGNVDLGIDIIDRGTKASIRKNIELHDAFMTYLKGTEGKCD